MEVLFMILLALAPAAGAAVMIQLLKKSHANYKNPLTKSLRRPPGAELGRKLGSAQLEAGFNVVEVVAPWLIPMVVYLSVRQSENEVLKVSLVVGSIAVAFALWLSAFRKFRARYEEIRNLRLGYECELAVGQELDLLMLDGSRVFHDLPADGFNIDHVVVSQAGVFAVETKGRSKRFPEEDSKSDNFKVAYRAGKLEFPYFTDNSTIPQSVRQAKWLSNWLSSATGLSINAAPLVVLPGWFVEIKDRPTVPVIASGYIDGYFKRKTEKVLDAEQITRIVHQLDAKVRDLKPGELVRPKEAD